MEFLHQSARSSRLRFVVCAALVVCVLIVAASPQLDALPTAFRARWTLANSLAHFATMALAFSPRSPAIPAPLALALHRETPFHPSLPARLSIVCERLC
jgi:hypothetical protein